MELLKKIVINKSLKAYKLSLSISFMANISKYKNFCGEIIKVMPKLKAEGRVPMSVAQLMEKRLDEQYSIKKPFSEIFVTGDAIAYYPEGRFKIVLDSQILRDLNPNTRLHNYSIRLSQKEFDLLEGKEFRVDDAGKLTDLLSKEEAKTHPVWRVLARDQGLLNEYVDYIFSQKKDNLGGMNVIIHPSLYGRPTLAPWTLFGLAERSFINGDCYLNAPYTTLMGVLPEH